MKSPLEGRPGLVTEDPATNALSLALGELAAKHGLRGAVMISFKGDRVNVNSSGKGDLFALAMERLGDDILAAIDDGKLDPDPQIAASFFNAPGKA